MVVNNSMTIKKLVKAVGFFLVLAVVELTLVVFSSLWYENAFFIPKKWQFVVVLGYFLITIGVFVVGHRLLQSRVSHSVRRSPWKIVIRISTAYLIYLAGSYLLTGVVSRYLYKIPEVPVSWFLFPLYSESPYGMIQNNIWPLMTEYMSMMLVAPLFEELFFREYLIGYLLREHSRFVQVVVSALLFTAIHIGRMQTIVDVLIYFFISILFYVTYTYRYRLIDSIVLHAMMNGAVGLFLIEIPRLLS